MHSFAKMVWGVLFVTDVALMAWLLLTGNFATGLAMFLLLLAWAAGAAMRK